MAWFFVSKNVVLNRRAMPKSASFARPRTSTRTFCGLRSRWTTFGSHERALSRSSASRSPGIVKRTGATHVNHVSGVPLTVIVAVCISAIVV